MQYNNKEVTEAIVNRLPPKRGTVKSPMIIALDGLEVGESITVNKDEWESAGYITPFSSLDGFVSSATYQTRVGKTGKVYKGKLFGKKFSTRKVSQDQKIVIRTL